ncbi:hypothetical protein [Treponema succinifaciens]|uniref:Uncharacterized protein n=1 Tax=Treponema succinifaciens (strain ATCC 33096 / DSM 2489 / 6091) TaxID=869209 RepID=F2NVG1_TRES6|nr:hypothetical protein [Treponema succinifaciens]AEB13671.1 hypothetical protein Tresu_0735 [Treponema succinifaciens DSM 2489]
MAAESLTRSSAINLINGSIDSFMFSHACYCTSNMESLSEDDLELYDQMHEVISILNDDEDYRHDLETMPLEDLKEFLLMCRKMADNNNLSLKSEFPQGNFEIVEDEKKDTTIVEKSIKKLEQHGDAQIQKAVSEYRKGKRKISFDNMSQNQLGQTNQINDFYCHAISEKLIQDTPENEIRLAITLAHEFKRNAVTDTLEGETRDIVLSDTKIIESFAGTYGEEIYKKFPEYGILHYIKKIFGEEELKDFADYAFDSTGSYWKVNETCDLVDDGNSSKVFDTSGNEVYSGSTGRQGTLEAWLEIDNAFVTLMKPAGYEYDTENNKWSKNPGKIEASKIKEAHDKGLITDDQYNLIQLAAGKASSKEEGAEKVSLFQQVLIDYQKRNEIDTQIKFDMVNRAWEWIDRKWNELFCKSSKNDKSSSQKKETQTSISFKELMETVKTDDLSSPCCDVYSTRVLELINKKPSDWPSPSGYKVCNTPNYIGNNYKDFYSSQWKTTPSEGWNVMIMWANSGEKFENSPHMAIVQKEDNSFNLTHFTGNKQKIRENWNLAQVENGFDYSNFRYLPLGK